MQDTPAQFPQVSLATLFGVFFYIGAPSFGGGVVAYLREHLVSRRKWLDEDHFLASLEIGQTVPGLVSTNVSVIVGSHLRGVGGGGRAARGVGPSRALGVFFSWLGFLSA